MSNKVPIKKKPSNMPVKKCCNALEIAWGSGMVEFAHTPYLSKDIHMVWVDQTRKNANEQGKRGNSTCIFCETKIKMV
jgi:hypothetical protein